MKILGISAYYHDSAVCFTEGGVIVFAAQEERFSRIKNDAAFPSLAIKKYLECNHTTLNDIDAIVFYEKPFLKLERILNTFLEVAPKGLFSFVQAMHIWTNEKLFIKKNIYRELKNIDPTFNRKNITLLFSEHHLSHAASAFYPSSFEEAAILTIDGVGEYATTTLAHGKGNKIYPLREIHFPDSIGLFYSAATYFLGFKVNSDEYKVMGLAAYGNAASDETIRFMNIIEDKLITLCADGSYHLNRKHFTFTYALTMVNDKDWQLLFSIDKRKPEDDLTQSHCNLAYAFQKVTEKAVLSLCYEVKKLTSSENLCLAGGVALNSVINGIIKDKSIFKNIFIQPASGDAGGALGAALAMNYLYFEKERNIVFPDAMQNGLLGNSFNENEIHKAIGSHPNYVKCVSESDLCKKTAQYLANGKVVGWVQGKMEFGPRALGNRSILADARNPNMQLHLNLKIKNRESFRPFAAAVLEEDGQKYFEYEGTSPYMLQVHKVKEKLRNTTLPENYATLSLKDKLYTLKSSIAAVTHADMSARIQTVNKEQHALFYKLIYEFKNITGESLLINTSFNVKDEPIVATPKNAYDCFMKTGMDVLVLGNYILTKE